LPLIRLLKKFNAMLVSPSRTVLRIGGRMRTRTVCYGNIFPKKNMELLDITAQQVVRAADKLNSRPRKCLDFQTSYEVFEKLTGVDVRKIMGYALVT
jgi:hypothetical protein